LASAAQPAGRWRQVSPTSAIGPYIVDLLAMQHRLVVGVDGGQDATDPSDAVRARWLARQGYRVIRFWNNDVLSNPECVVALISMAIAL